MSNFSQDGSRYQQYASDFAADNKAKLMRCKPVVKEISGKRKVYFEVVFLEGTKRWPFNFFCKDLPTQADVDKLKKDAPKDVYLQWGRKGHMEDDEFVLDYDEEGNALWGKPRVLSIVSESGEVWELTGGVDQYQGDENGTDSI